MINRIAMEIAKWIDAHMGLAPSKIRVPQAIVDECIAEAKYFGNMHDDEYVGEGLRILGISVFVDPTLTIGKIDP